MQTLGENDEHDFRGLRDTEKTSRTDDGDVGRLGGLEQETTVQLPPLNLSEAERVETSEVSHIPKKRHLYDSNRIEEKYLKIFVSP